MRRMLDALYDGCAWLAAVFMIGVLVMVLLSVLGRQFQFHVLGKLKGRARRGLELWSLSVAVLLSGLFAWFAVRLVWQSIEFHDISTGNDATPLWIPQLAMALGTLVLFIAIVDEWVLEARGQRQRFDGSEAHHE
ncbi:MAG: hypothetical protein A3I64_07385 [Burkholderiales bacterium RIFCSPLOWO2_02_FULL_67_64]|nr:MAG: hypothetical protein A3I64_07385 [Burkholderiales bacterium RIFCSPLOWO2_02_FULL_67_64]